MLLSESKSSSIPLFRRSGLLKVVNVRPLCSTGVTKVEVYKGGQPYMKSSMKYTSQCFFGEVSCCDHVDPIKRSNSSYIGNLPRLGVRSLRDISAHSDLARSGTPDLASPFPDVSVGPKVRGACFYAVTAAAAILLFGLMVVAHPFVLLFDRYRRRAQHFVARMWATLTITPFLKVEFEGLENLPGPDTPAVYVSNHQSFLDIYALLTLERDFKFISKTSIFIYPIIGWAMFLLGVIPLKRMDSRSQLDCLKRCMDLIRGGASVFFFPEGTRSKTGELGAFKKGAFSVAVKTGVPVVPMTIMGTGRIMPSGKEGILNPGSVKVVIHPILRGNDAQALCDQARGVIADTLER
ncbi:1-acyl-sn-glycerol-3-phosphate acyltransferase BAT2, chloroplastic-like [Silene latifolia]|uniref:1-acyl-sn-glycerol-3-phosphate acyltransferase BAT2, chloroplastic-like n=1 Tax=Silene latifolia TaxID=37657 RepID=UPI003D7775FC